MSGSPILQDGRIVGAVTHVFVNDPTRGYGVGIETMLNAVPTADSSAVHTKGQKNPDPRDARVGMGNQYAREDTLRME